MLIYVFEQYEKIKALEYSCNVLKHFSVTFFFLLRTQYYNVGTCAVIIHTAQRLSRIRRYLKK